jgi:hypothetical protein
MSETKQTTRDIYFDKFIGKYFDTLWNSEAYLDTVSKGIDMVFEARSQWNKNMETVLSFFQLPNQQMQQKTLHSLNMLLSEWRFEQEELKLRLDKIEKDIAELKLTGKV